jgi:hypothetical protein
MTSLSPQAQAVLDAANGANSYGPDDCLNESRWIAAAALRAAADQVAPDDAVEPRNYIPMAMECQRIRRKLIAIAAELETVND